MLGASQGLGVSESLLWSDVDSTGHLCQGIHCSTGRVCVVSGLHEEIFLYYPTSLQTSRLLYVLRRRQFPQTLLSHVQRLQ